MRRVVLLASGTLHSQPPSNSFAGAGELAPNELGRIMVLEYHKIDYPEASWTRTPENFRRDLETLYAKGYRLINLGDLLDRRFTLPGGTTPVVLTFDDSSPGQFRYLEHDGTLEIDPKSAVGILGWAHFEGVSSDTVSLHRVTPPCTPERWKVRRWQLFR